MSRRIDPPRSAGEVPVQSFGCQFRILIVFCAEGQVPTLRRLTTVDKNQKFVTGDEGKGGQTGGDIIGEPDAPWVVGNMTWVLPGSPLAAKIHQALFAAYPTVLNSDHDSIVYKIENLQTHPGVTLVEAMPTEYRDINVYAFLGERFVHFICGEPEDIYELNLWSSPRLSSDDERAAYLRLWMEIARGSEGWRLIEAAADVECHGPVDNDEFKSAVQSIQPLIIEDPDKYGRRKVHCAIQRQGELVARELYLWPDGLITVRRDTLLISRPEIQEPAAFVSFQSLRARLKDQAIATDLPGPAISLEGTYERPGLDLDASADTIIGNSTENLGTVTSMDSEAYSGWDLNTLFQRIAAVLLHRALAQTKFAKRGNGVEQKFYNYLKEFRPIVAIETPYREIRNDVAKQISEGTGLYLELGWGNGPGRDPKSAAVVLMTEATFPDVTDDPKHDYVTMLSAIIRNPHVGLLIVERISALPSDVRDMIDFSVTMPRMDAATFWSCSTALFDKNHKQRKADWIRYVMPRDMVRTAAATRDYRAYYRELELGMKRRLAQYTAPAAPSLIDLQGLGEARYQMESLAADIRGALNGTIKWDQVDRGYLLVGPPGTGKTTLVKALAKDCNIRFILASAGSWQERATLGPHIQAIRSTFREARLFAPAILFIDEIDSLGTRRGTEEHNSQYQTVVINTVLEELQGFQGREGVIVIGATNNIDGVDEAIRRPGRLDRIVRVPYPNVAALVAIYDYYIALALKDGITADPIDTKRLAQLTFGRTGAHVELYVRSAVRRARHNGTNKIVEQDILNEITSRPPEGFEESLTPEVMKRTAVHEAGHAVIALTGSDTRRDIPMISIIPRADGSLGFVARAPSEMGVMTRDGMEESIRVALGGRAAEELVFGRDNISGGSGGGGGSDLAAATHSVLWLLTEFGFSESGGLLWIDWRSRGETSQVTAEAIRNLPMGNDILHEARRTADRLYSEALERLKEHRALLDKIVDRLVERQELSSDELRVIMKV